MGGSGGACPPRNLRYPCLAPQGGLGGFAPQESPLITRALPPQRPCLAPVPCPQFLFVQIFSSKFVSSEFFRPNFFRPNFFRPNFFRPNFLTEKFFRLPPRRAPLPRTKNAKCEKYFVRKVFGRAVNLLPENVMCFLTVFCE